MSRLEELRHAVGQGPSLDYEAPTNGLVWSALDEALGKIIELEARMKVMEDGHPRMGTDTKTPRRFGNLKRIYEDADLEIGIRFRFDEGNHFEIIDCGDIYTKIIDLDDGAPDAVNPTFWLPNTAVVALLNAAAEATI